MKQLTFASLQVLDLEASKNFYTKKLGFEIGETNPEACVFKYNKGEASFAIRTHWSLWLEESWGSEWRFGLL